MSFNGSGTFVINTAGQPVVPNTVISATAFNALTADLANGLSTCITKDGQTTPTANIPMGNNKITGLAAGTAGTDAANLSQVQGSTAKLLQSVTGTDTITAAMVPALTSYSAGQMFYFVAAGDNTGAVTINIDSLGAKSVTRDGSTALVAGDITNGKVVVIVYDGTRFQLLNSNAFTNLYVSGNLGVGTASPTTKLDVNGSGIFSGTLTATLPSSVGLITSRNWTTTATELHIRPNSGKSGWLSFTEDSIADRWIVGVKNGNGGLFFNTGNPGSNTDRMVLDSSGNLGIGTSSPSCLLDVRGQETTNYNTARFFNGIDNQSLDVLCGRALTNGTVGGVASSLVMTLRSSGSSAGVLAFATGNDERGRFEINGNFLVGTTTNPNVLNRSVVIDSGASSLAGIVLQNNTTGRTSTDGSHITIAGAELKIVNLENDIISISTNNLERARFTAGGSLIVGHTAASGSEVLCASNNSAVTPPLTSWNRATSGDNYFAIWYTEGTATLRGSIDYNRAGGLTRYNTTSDYRAKEIIGPVQDSGATIDALKVYRGKMHGATIERPMLIAHEAQECAPYAVTGEKDAVNADGDPIYQQIDTSSLVPLLIAEIQSLRTRVATLEAK